jgi:hypothetical protein
MPYISGNFHDYLPRIHQFGTGVDILSLFYLEAVNNNYTGQPYASGLKRYWNKEFVKKGQIIDFPTGISGTLFP